MSRKRFGLMSAQYSDFLTRGGRVITHHNAAQMAWLFPGARVVELPFSIPNAATAPILTDPEFLGAFDTNGDLIKAAFRDQS